MKQQEGVLLGAGLLGLGFLGTLALVAVRMRKAPPEAVIGLRVEQEGGLMRYVYTLDNPTSEPITIAKYNSIRNEESWGWADLPGAIWTIQPGEFGERYFGWAAPGYYAFQALYTYSSAVELMDTEGKVYQSEAIVFTIEA